MQDARRQAFAGAALAADNQRAERHLIQFSQKLPYALRLSAMTDVSIRRITPMPVLGLIDDAALD